jgi:hypothetical protein
MAQENVPVFQRFAVLTLLTLPLATFPVLLVWSDLDDRTREYEFMTRALIT